METIKPYIEVFPHDNELYSLQWIGAVKYSSHLAGSLVICVWLQKLSGQNQGAIHTAEVAIGMMPLLVIGTIWQNGWLIEETSLEEITVHDLRLKGKDEVPVSALATYGEKKFFIVPAR